MLPSITVVIPLYNHEKFISAALYSVFSQSYKPREIIVIDDGSSDSSFAVAQGLARGRPEMVVWRQRNRGAHNTINSGIQRATSDLVAILNSDDEYEPDRLRAAADAFHADSRLDALATGMRFTNQSGELTGNAWYDESYAYYRSVGDLGKALINGNIVVTTSNLVARRATFDALGGFSNLRYAHDLNFFLRLLSEGRKFKIIEDKLLRYRTHDSNTISEGHDKVKAEWAIVVALYIYNLSMKSGCIEIDHVRDVLKKHGLMEGVLFLLAHFMQNPPRSPERLDVLADAKVIQTLREMIQ